MYKIIIFSLIALFFSKIQSQNISTVSYDVLYSLGRENKPDFFVKMEEASKNLEYLLIFNDSVSNFKLKNKLSKSEPTVELAASSLIAKGDYYKLKKDNFFLLKTEDVVVKKMSDSTRWEITNETKKIDNFICYKAIKFKEVKNRKGTFKHQITAWFCPEIPFSYGPLSYEGLPGLILELIEMPAIHFVAKKIELKASEEKIEMPNSRNVISEEEFYKKLKENSFNKMNRN